MNQLPWFVTPEDEEFNAEVLKTEHDAQPRAASLIPPIPHDVPDHIRELHTMLSTSPYLDRSNLLVSRPREPVAAPPLPFRSPKGRRRVRGGTDFGVGIDMPNNGIWDWCVLAQVKEGTEGKGSISNVIKDIRKKLRELAKSGAIAHVPHNRRQLSTDGWEMLDIGDFAVHILSKEAREKWFPTPSDVMAPS